jgi:hypothetical protein
VFPGRILQVGVPKAIVVDFQGRKVEAVLGPDTAFVWGEQDLDPNSLKEGFVVEVTVAKALSPVCVIAQAIRLVDPAPEKEPKKGRELGGNITGARVTGVSVSDNCLFVVTDDGQKLAVMVDKRTSIHKGPHVWQLGQISNGSVVDIRGRKKGDRWTAADITIH